MTTPSQSYPIAKVAQIMGCSAATVYKKIRRGEITAFSIGTGRRGLRITADEIVKWQQTTVAVTSSADEEPSMSSNAMKAIVAAASG